MKKILIRSSMPFYGTDNISESLIYNYVGDNTGNLLFQSSVIRWIMTEDTEITTINVKANYSQSEVDFINSEYDMFVIPLANAFRVAFMKGLDNLTAFIKRLTIPCIVVGLGLQKNLTTDGWKFKFDGEAKGFIEAVLEKSGMIGLRGEITGEYFKRLGFVPEKDYTVIGCPSLYMYGELPPVKEVDLNENTLANVVYKANIDPKIYAFLRKEVQRFPKYKFVSQVVPEMKTMYVGYKYVQPQKKFPIPKDYPVSITKDIMKDDHMIGFVDMKSWLEFLREREFSFGSRIHGSIANIISGNPSFVFAEDARVKELCDYHNLAYMNYKDVKEDMTILDLHEKTDYHRIFTGHKERVDHFVDFLDKNDIVHLSWEEICGKDTPFDHHLDEIPALGAITPFSAVPLKEQERRIREYFAVLENKEQNVRNEFADYRKTANQRIKELEQNQKKLEKELRDIKCRKFYKIQNKMDQIRKK